MNYKNLYTQPLLLNHNRVWRAYTGGKLLDEWKGIKNPEDTHYPEEWIASIVEARNVEHIKHEGLSTVNIDNNILFLKDIIDSNPEKILGEKHFKKYGNTMGFLVKAIDTKSRIQIQVHPDKEYAKKYLNSDYGKTEAWYIIGGRKINNEDPYILLGFKENISRLYWENAFYSQNISDMINALHKFYVKKDDIFIINGGLPHAIGPGCFLIEIQEPTDFTMRVEKVTLNEKTMPEEWYHQGVGFKNMFDCFHYDNYTKEEVLCKYCLIPSITEMADGTVFEKLISNQYFSMNKILVSKSFFAETDGTFSVAIVASGKGKIIWGEKEMNIKQSDELFIPASIYDYKWLNEGDNYLEIIMCNPPKS
jgi:mannose-6-phosphate isomerase